MSSPARTSMKSAEKTNLLGKRNPQPKYEPETEWTLKKHKERSEEKEVKGVELSSEANLVPVKETVEGLDEAPHFVEGVAARKKTLIIDNLSPRTKISDIINFFKDVGRVVSVRRFLKASMVNICVVEALLFILCYVDMQDVGEFITSVRLIVNFKGRHVGYGFVEFADAYSAKMALEEKNGEYLHDHKIFLEGAKAALCSPRPKYRLAEKLWYEDSLLRESLLIEEDETLERCDETPSFLEEAVDVRKRTLFIGNLTNRTRIYDIINFMKDVAAVVRVRLMVNQRGYHLGYGFVEFASADEATKAQEKKNGEYLYGHHITLGAAEMAPYTPLPVYCVDHKVWYEDYLRGESLLTEEEEEDEAAEGLDDFVEEVSVRKKTLFIDRLTFGFKMRDPFNLFPEAGVVSVRLTVDDESELVGCGFVEFASAITAKKLLKERGERGGGRLSQRFLVRLGMVRMAAYPLRPKYKLAESLWYLQEYLPQERLWIEEEKKEFCGEKITYSCDDD